MEDVFKSIGVRYSKNGRIICNGKNWKIILEFINQYAIMNSGSAFDGMTDGHEKVERTMEQAMQVADKIMERGGFDRRVTCGIHHVNYLKWHVITVRDCTEHVNFYISPAAFPCR